ncbi:hypothetical protein ElyMa_006999700 [Elysia marginata]|uniref:Secreted protein n=1 Tax=Elysia marginata TaxID=1093978 RepID=A0AAV4JPS1_9GAST|nr:hypothetical protein ElyMa_006999700 [Elysia marginata]
MQLLLVMMMSMCWGNAAGVPPAVLLPPSAAVTATAVAAAASAVLEAGARGRRVSRENTLMRAVVVMGSPRGQGREFPWGAQLRGQRGVSVAIVTCLLAGVHHGTSPAADAGVVLLVEPAIDVQSSGGVRARIAVVRLHVTG